MKTSKRYLWSLICLSLSTLIAYGNPNEPGDKSATPYQPKKGDPVDGVRIGWNYSTLQ